MDSIVIRSCNFMHKGGGTNPSDDHHSHSVVNLLAYLFTKANIYSIQPNNYYFDCTNGESDEEQVLVTLILTNFQ